MIEFAVTFSPGADLEVNMGQVMEVYATEERTVELSMPSGNQVILPTSSKGMRKVTIQKPDTMLPENIKKDVVIGGVTGALEAPPTGPYIEYTSLDSSGRVFTAKFRGTIVPEHAFSYLAELTSVDMPDNVIAIGDNGFYRCPKLQLTSLPSEITSLGDFAFSDCSKLALTSLPSGITSIGDQAFRDCFSLALTGLPSRITSIGDCCFDGAILFPPVINRALRNVQFLTEQLDGFTVSVALDDFGFELGGILFWHSLISLIMMRSL